MEEGIATFMVAKIKVIVNVIQDMWASNVSSTVMRPLWKSIVSRS
jgi:hypothetical protein